MVEQTKLKAVTEQDLMALGEDVRAEIIDGELVIMSPNKGGHGEIIAVLLEFLGIFVRLHRLGRLFSENTGFMAEFDEAGNLIRARMPDVAYVSFERLPVNASPWTLFTFAPDLAVEVISESETYSDIATKTQEYFARGAAQVWHILPVLRQVRVCTPDNQAGMIFGEDDVLPGGDVLSGFTLPVRAIFDTTDHALHEAALRRLMEA